jgi:hypothetical protein
MSIFRQDPVTFWFQHAAQRQVPMEPGDAVVKEAHRYRFVRHSTMAPAVVDVILLHPLSLSP